MGKKPILAAINEGKVLVSDGAWGTALMQGGAQMGECFELLNKTKPEMVSSIAESYFAAGADFCLTNTFGGSGVKLKSFGLESDTYELNRAGAACSVAVCDENHWVLGSIGPTGKMLLMDEVTEEELFQGFFTQAKGLSDGGVDAICVETMMDAQEACIAVDAAKKATNLPVFCTFTFEKMKNGEFKTIFGLTPAAAAQSALEAGADVIGTNCGNGMEQMAEIVKQIRAAHSTALILVHANAGLPVMVEGEMQFLDTPEKMQDEVVAVMENGANIVGGCCGTNPLHIAAIKKSVEEFNKR